MAIYVDPAVHPFGRMIMCHMMTDGDISELHEFAARLGMKRSWFQNHPTHPHYDISKGKREQAIRMGAIEVSGREQARLCSLVFRKEQQEQQEPTNE